jgi:ACR3 family arsenite efflux pump ArsB
MIKSLYVEGGLYTVIAMGAPWLELLRGDADLTGRSVAATAIASLVAGATALKAFLSTSYSRATGDALLVRDPRPNETPS